MVIIKHHRFPESFERIKTGEKKIEIRLFDEKRQKIKIGDIIEAYKAPEDKEMLRVKVTGLTRFDNFKDLFFAFGDIIKEEDKEILKKVYTREKEKKYGVLVIHFKKTPYLKKAEKLLK